MLDSTLSLSTCPHSHWCLWLVVVSDIIKPTVSILQPHWHLKTPCDRRVQHGWLLAATRHPFLSLSKLFWVAACHTLAVCIGSCELFGSHCYFFNIYLYICSSVALSLPLWPCSAALAICAKENREQRDGRRAVVVGEGKKSRRGKW